MNHLAHSEAMKHARTVEANLRGEVDNVKMSNSKLQEELRRTREEASSLPRAIHTYSTPSYKPSKIRCVKPRRHSKQLQARKRSVLVIVHYVTHL